MKITERSVNPKITLHSYTYFTSLQDSIFGGSPTRELDKSIEGPLSSSVEHEAGPMHHPLSKMETAATTKNASSSEDSDTFTTTTAAERKPGVFHAAGTSQQKAEKQTVEYVEETQGCHDDRALPYCMVERCSLLHDIALDSCEFD